MKNLTIEEIKNLKLEIKTDYLTAIEWFEITDSGNFFEIRSGLNTPIGIKPSPYYFRISHVGKEAKEMCINDFNKWFETLNLQTEIIKRNSGRTTRIVDNYIQELFRNGKIENIKDHDNIHMNNVLVFHRIRDRLRNEHKCTKIKYFDRLLKIKLDNE